MIKKTWQLGKNRVSEIHLSLNDRVALVTGDAQEIKGRSPGYWRNLELQTSNLELTSIF